VSVGDGFIVGRNKDAKADGSLTVDFENCVVTAKTFAVYCDRPLNKARFNGTRFVFGAAGGSIVASDDAANWITVGDDGLTLDTQAYSTTLNANLGGSGTVTKVGAGTLTVSRDQATTGRISVNEGTLAIDGSVTFAGSVEFAADTALDIAAPASDVAAFAATKLILPVEGKVTLTSGGGAFGEGLYAICKMSGVTPEAGAKFAPSTGELAVSWSVVGDMLMLEVGDVKNTWTGAANDGDLSNHDNWYGREVPTSGNCIIGNVSGADLTVGDIFAATSITFPAYSGPITISGERTLSGITAIVNNAPVHHVFNCPIVCADGVTPDITRGKDNYMTFAGGITMYDTPKTGGGVVDYWSGNITLTTESPVTYATNGDENYGFLVSGTTFTFNNGKIDRMNIDAGATAVVERLLYHNTVRKNNSAYYNEVFDNGSGTIRTKEVKNTGTAVLFHSYADSDMVGGTIIAEKLTCATTVQTGGAFGYPVFMLNCGTLSGSTVTTGAANGEGVWVIGPGGLAFGETIHSRSQFETKIGKSLGGRPAATLHSYADWTLQSSPKGRNKTALNIGSANGGFIVIDTSHYAIGEAEYDSATSHTVTLDGQIVGGPMRVEGNGKVVFANEYNTFSGLTVTDTATASVKAGCKPGTGVVTLEAGTILEVAESGAVTLGGDLALADGSTLAFNFTERKVGPLLALASEKSLSFVGEGEKNIAVKVSGDVWPVGGKHILTATGGFNVEGVTVSLAEGAPKWAKSVYVNEDGNIVLDVKPIGMKVIVR
jgi:autotransporter-associated beta strand protein